VLGEPIDGKPLTEDVEKRPIHISSPSLSDQENNSLPFITGIKVIDLLMPFPMGGKIGLIGGAGVGKTVLMIELMCNT
jgi:F-type H+/Na+-transporting ATPase subunit beta